MSEVCEEYVLRRETYHFSVHYLDALMHAWHHLDYTRLQLVATTALYLGSKVCEVYPPSALDFSCTTDGACSPAQIIQLESPALEAMKWKLTPVTTTSYAATNLRSS